MKKIQELIKTTKGKIMIWALSFAIVGGGYILSQIPPSAEKILDKYTRLEKQKVGLGSEYLSKFDGKGIFGKLEIKRLEEMTEIVSVNIDRLQKEMNTVEVVSVDIQEGEYGGYDNIVTTVKNNGTTTINYVELDLFYKDENKTIVKSEWTNDNAKLKPGATQKIEKMTKKDDSWKYVTVEVSDFK